MSNPLIAIDGPAGSGKSTVAESIARRLGLPRLDTGAMYRAVTLLALRSGTSVEDGDELARLARRMELDVGERVVSDGEDVTSEIRTPAVDEAVSAVAAHPALRAELVKRQRRWAAEHDGAVVEGRDIGTVVFPDADLKVYLTADPVERARRRQLQREEPSSRGVADAGALFEIERRDAKDAGRPVSPMKVAENAMVLDSTHLSVEEVVEQVLSRL